MKQIYKNYMYFVLKVSEAVEDKGSSPSSKSLFVNNSNMMESSNASKSSVIKSCDGNKEMKSSHISMSEVIKPSNEPCNSSKSEAMKQSNTIMSEVMKPKGFKKSKVMKTSNASKSGMKSGSLSEGRDLSKVNIIFLSNIVSNSK